MPLTLMKKLFGSRNDRLLKKYDKKLAQINQFEPELQALSDEALQAKTDEFKQAYQSGTSLEHLLPEAFAVVREASQRVTGLRHYDTQLIGGMVLHHGNIAEMRTGEGKTLVATLPAYLNALSGKGVHVITVNDYLASRDAEWMGQIYGFLGLETGTILSGQSPEEKKAAYNADITYGTNNEFGFDYLRDNMAIFAEERVMRGQNFAIVDEVDSILIDEARTPLIISGPAEDQSELYQTITPLVTDLERGEEDPETKTASGDYTIDEKSKQIHLTDEGHSKIEEKMTQVGLLEEGDSLYDAEHISLMKYVTAAMRASLLFEKNTDYIVENGQVVIIDEFTGRKMHGRRWGDGLHQAVEAKEGVAIQAESQTYASITFQNYFRQYETLSGMTGTADTEAGEFLSTYQLEVVVVPTNQTPQRLDLPDLVFLDVEGKLTALVRDVKEIHKTGQPMLVGTASIEMSEVLSAHFDKAGIPHKVLNAKQHEKEAHIIAQAGQPGAVTIATNMAGRGTDIVLGGNLDMELERLENKDEATVAQVKADWQKRHQEVLDKGGLMVIGSERHESRRIDNQLRGRSGRQGDPGVTRFYLSLDDDLMRRFASDKVKSMMRRLGMKSDEAIEHNMVSKSIERAQKQVERMHQDERANLLKFDNIANEQRKVVYTQRNELMEVEDVSEIIDSLRATVIENAMAQFVPPGSLDEQWDIPGLTRQLHEDFGVDLPIQDWLEADKSLYEETLREKIVEAAKATYEEKMQVVDPQTRHHFEKEVLLRTIDKQWRGHLNEMDYLRRWIHLKGFAQKDPFQEYRKTAASMFEAFLDEVMFETVQTLSLVQIQGRDDVNAYEQQQLDERPDQLEATHPAAQSIAQAVQPEEKAEAESEDEQKPGTFRRDVPKVGRNDPCPCGSGKKYKQCCGRLQ
ncbi:preprotein translocase subunit SecA [Hydrogenovibrio halophilus]|uniref:preprotein translocase subunit SecA n=1 Tax=Hydrogenovibrio halophilus TaxID=373391 RepID=UPI00036CAC7E|nr:preprotein translocase subunit SecA [Hydrogenovibrio halophilus]